MPRFSATRTASTSSAMFSIVYLATSLSALGAAGAAFVNKDEAMGAGERQKPGEKVGMVSTGTSVEHDERRALAELDVVDEHTVGVDIAIVLRVDGGRRLGGGRLGGEGEGKDQGWNQAEELHGNEDTGFRAVSIHVLPFEDGARWHFLEENVTWRRGFCKEQNRNRCSEHPIQGAAVIYPVVYS